MGYNGYLPEDDVLVVDEVDTAIDKGYHIVVYNDEVNTFEHVISCFVDILTHSEIQAEQCALIIHHNGSCSVKKGSAEYLTKYNEALCNEYIDARVEKQ
jgi:ATP-dependent Clp protease adaptor protein ClpS